MAASSQLPFATIGPYELISQLGRGGMGSVYLARHVHLKRFVAVKMLPAHALAQPQSVARFRQEMEVIGQLRHANIIAATDAGEEAGCHFLVMDYVGGADLGRLLRRHRRFAVADACELTRQTAEALVCLHQHGLVHRDIKPSNLLLGPDGVVRVLDLGLALLHGVLQDQEPLTDVGQVMGTADFIAPEQGGSSHAVDIRADIYSLGCTLYTLLAGQPPFAGPRFPNFYAKVQAHRDLPIPPLRHACPDVPEPLLRLLDRMLAKDPEDRLAAPKELVEQLAPFAVGHDLPALLAGTDSVGDDLDEDNYLQRVTTPERARATAGDVPAPVVARPSRWRRRLAVGLLVVLGGIFLWAAVDTFNPDRQHLAPQNPEPGPPRELKPGWVYDVLNWRPTVVSWPSGSPLSRWDHFPDKRELWLNCSTRGLLELLRVEGHAYNFECTVAQNPWVGGVGVYFCGREDAAARASGVWADFLYLDRFDRSTSKTARLTRGHLRRPQPDSTPFMQLLMSVELPLPTPGEHRLSLSVDPEGLTWIAWDGQQVGKSLCEPQRQLPRRAGPHGSLGFLVQGSHAHIRDVRFSPLAPPRTRP